MNKTAYATKQDVQEIVDKAVTKAVDDIAGIVNDFSNQVAEKFNEVDERFDKIDERFDKIDERFDKIDERFDKIDDQIGAMMRRLERQDDRMTTLESMLQLIRAEIEETRNKNQAGASLSQTARLDKMERWIEQIAKKTGVKLTAR